MRLILLLILLGCGNPGTGHAPHVTSTEIGQRANEDLEGFIRFIKLEVLLAERRLTIEENWKVNKGR